MTNCRAQICISQISQHKWLETLKYEHLMRAYPERFSVMPACRLESEAVRLCKKAFRTTYNVKNVVKSSSPCNFTLNRPELSENKTRQMLQ